MLVVDYKKRNDCKIFDSSAKIIYCMKLSRHEDFAVSRSSSKNREIRLPRKMHFELNREVKMREKSFNGQPRN